MALRMKLWLLNALVRAAEDKARAGSSRAKQMPPLHLHDLPLLLHSLPCVQSLSTKALNAG